MESENRWVTAVLLVAMIGGVVLCLWRISTTSPTANEALLLSLFLTFLSIIGSWIASRYYSESSYNKNLRIFALKAAEKVTNLSNELDRLSVFIQQELKGNEYDSPAEALLAQNIRFEGAVHIINTLKSVNDRSLSDWQGVIGDEISARQEVQEEREETLRELLVRLDSLQDATITSSQVHHDEERDHLFSEVKSIRNDLRLLASQVSGFPIAPVRLSRRKEVQKTCPSCGSALSYRQKSSSGNVRGVQCTKCGARLCSREKDGDYVLAERTAVDESVTCPSCAEKIDIKADPVPGSVSDIACCRCKVALRVSRANSGLRLRIVGEVEAAPLGEDFLRKVADLMGPQPWPKGRSKQVAGELDVNPSLIGRATQELIRRGTFKPQIDGQLYARET